MVGFFSRLAGGHRRAHSSSDPRQTSASNAELSSSNVSGAVVSGTEVVLEFKPVEHPTEPLNRDQPVRCPLPEPSILNDGRIWKERLSASNRTRADQQVTKEGPQTEPEASQSRQLPLSSKLSMLSSLSAPEHAIVNLLEECNAAGV